jgi:hypothetical protein
MKSLCGMYHGIGRVHSSFQITQLNNFNQSSILLPPQDNCLMNAPHKQFMLQSRQQKYSVDVVLNVTINW